MFNNFLLALSDISSQHADKILMICALVLLIEWAFEIKKFIENKKKPLWKIILLFILPLLFIWAFYGEQQMLITKRQTICIKNLPQKFENYKIVFITDTHTGCPYVDLKKINRVKDLANKQKPDMLILGGDYEITGMMFSKYIEADKTAKILNKINAPDGKYAILGNHDYFNGKTKVKNQLIQEGFTVLENRTLNIGSKTEPLYLTGLGDFDFGEAQSQILKNIPKEKPSIVLVHEPDEFPQLPYDTDLTLSGHTHGGQVRIPFLGSLLTPSSYGERYAKGLKTENGKQLFVSSGIGTSILPVRFCDPPEIVVITLKRA